MHPLLEKMDLEKNGLAREVSDGIRAHRQGDFRLTLHDDAGNALPGVPVRLRLTRHAFRFGGNAFMAGGFDDPAHNAAYDACFREVFNEAVLPFFWKDEETEPGRFRFGKDSEPRFRRPPPDFMLDWCRDVGAEPKGHSLVWDGSGLPDWRPEEPAELEAALVLRIRAVAGRYASSIRVWDVVNEFLSRFPHRFPKDYHLRFFQLAEELFPDGHLIANEDTERTWDSFTGDSSRFYLYLQHLLASGRRVDGIGMQYHLFSKKDRLHERLDTTLNAANLRDCLAFYALLDRPIHISEISIPTYNEGAEWEEWQARMTDHFYRLCFAGSHTASIVWWNLVDGYASSLPQWGWDENIFGAGLFRKDFTPKPAWHVIRDLITKEWHTEVKGVTGKDGSFAFTGFHGSYALELSGSAVAEDLTFGPGHETLTFTAP
jgi:endo-1,4-beta-xylanase